MRRTTAMFLVATLALGVASVVSAGTASGDEPVGGARLCDEVLVEMSDGVRLHAWVSRLAPDQARPVLLEIESYNVPSDTCPTTLPSDGTSAYVDQGLVERFTLVHVSYRGTGSSEGVFDMTAPRTQLDVDEVIDWAAGQPWSDGRIVLTGQSGTGFGAHHGLDEDPVVAAVIYSSCADMYRCFRRGGVYNALPEVYLARTELGWAFGLAQRLAHGTASNPGAAAQQLAFVNYLARTKTELRNTPWWTSRSALDTLANVDVPVLYTSDAYDIVSSYDAYLRTPGSRLVLGFGHSTEPAITANPDRHAELVRSYIDRFLAHVVFNEDNGADTDPEVVLMTNTGSTATWRAGATYIRGESAWPLPQTDWTTLYLAGGPSGSALSLNDGKLSPNAPANGGDLAVLLSTPDVRVDSRTTNWLLGENFPSDLRVNELLGLTYTTPVFTENLELTGPITLQLAATATASNFDWSVRLTDVHPDGRSEFITDGYLRANLRQVDTANSLYADGRLVRPFYRFDNPQPVPLLQRTDYTIEIIPTTNIFRAGHRLRLDILPIVAGGLDSVLTLGVGAVTVHRGAQGSRLLLPVIPAGCDTAVPLRASDPTLTCADSYADAID
ncbi:MAG TPA: CocE/NonD family hydrolase [Ilumatobacter sp.]|nr:CocE/NonD family hydrolase [Ilumatobacter sp.]